MRGHREEEGKQKKTEEKAKDICIVFIDERFHLLRSKKRE